MLPTPSLTNERTQMPNLNIKTRPKPACQWCGSEFELARHGPPKLFCCSAHRVLSHQKRVRDEARKFRAIAGVEQQGVAE